MKNLKIRRKLIVTMGILVVLIVNIGIVASVTANYIAGFLDQFYNGSFQNVEYLDSLGENLNQAAKICFMRLLPLKQM